MTYVLFDSGICGERLWECVACGSRRIRYWRPKRFHFTDGACREEFHIYRCEQCGTGFLNQPPSARWLQSIYSLSGQALTRTVTLEEILAKEARYPNCTVDAERIAGRVNRFDTSENGRALDIGSGFGFYTRALRKRGYHTVSINPGKYENAVFKELNGDDPLEVSFEAYYPCGSFGVVLMSQVLEHL
ncbi:MAG: class I SAM-dependent methyltransferase, partial [Gammaproteobacteria bacterium]